MTLWEKFKKLVMIEQTLFGAFWFLSAILIAHIEWPELPIMLDKYFWIVCAFIGARIAGMSLNRVTDRKIDAQNPRTRDRLIPSGLLSVLSVKFVAISGLLLLTLSCFMLGKLVFSMLPVMVFFLWVYAYTKRWTYCCHFVLGIVCGFAPLFAYLAVAGKFTLTPVLLALAQACIISSNDTIYALQDFSFEKMSGVKSFPVAFGVEKTLICSKVLQVTSVLLLLYLGVNLSLSLIYYCAVAGISGLFYYFQSLLKNINPENVDPIFFKSNVYSGMVLFIFLIGELIWRGF